MCSVYTILGQPSYFDFPFRTLLMQKLEFIVMIKYWKIYQQVEKRLKQKILEKLNRKIKSFITLYFCTYFGLSMWTNHFNVNIRRSLSLQHQYLSKLGKYKLAFMYWPWSPDNLYIYSWAYFEHCTYVFSIYFLFAF